MTLGTQEADPGHSSSEEQRMIGNEESPPGHSVLSYRFPLNEMTY